MNQYATNHHPVIHQFPITHSVFGLRFENVEIDLRMTVLGQASFVTLRAKGGWLVSATRVAATAAEIARGSGSLVNGVQIEATVPGTLRLVDPWPASSGLPLVSCKPGPTSPEVSHMNASGRTGLIGWTMKAGQKCDVRPRERDASPAAEHGSLR